MEKRSLKKVLKSHVLNRQKVNNIDLKSLFYV